jgi:hypothetical protein
MRKEGPQKKDPNPTPPNEEVTAVMLPRGAEGQWQGHEKLKKIQKCVISI